MKLFSKRNFIHIEKILKRKADITKDFINEINQLIEKKVFRNRREVVDKLNWNETALSLVMAGKRPVPEDKAIMLDQLFKSEKKLSLVEEGTPIYELAATATQSEYSGQLPEIPAFHVKIPGYEDCNFGMHVFGHSMYPTIETGSLVLCRKVNDKSIIMYGEIYLIRTADYLMVKRLQKNKEKGHVLCTSDNFEKRNEEFKRFEPFELSVDKIIDLYLVKGIIKKTQT